tara:strand:+ start:1861 stop:2196 length:336 start_codon:yes stop_codon:yes gene_type:complete
MYKKYNKFNAVKTKIDNITFDSKKEANRYLELQQMQKIGVINQLECQPRIPLIVNGKQIGHYIGDFKYLDKTTNTYILEDVKSKATRTPVYKLKKKILETYKPPLIITEVY